MGAVVNVTQSNFIELLDEDNYYTWASRLRLNLMSRGLWHVVKAGLTDKKEAGEQKLDSQALGFLGSAVSSKFFNPGGEV